MGNVKLQYIPISSIIPHLRANIHYEIRCTRWKNKGKKKQKRKKDENTSLPPKSPTSAMANSGIVSFAAQSTCASAKPMFNQGVIFPRCMGRCFRDPLAIISSPVIILVPEAPDSVQIRSTTEYTSPLLSPLKILCVLPSPIRVSLAFVSRVAAGRSSHVSLDLSTTCLLYTSDAADEMD